MPGKSTARPLQSARVGPGVSVAGTKGARNTPAKSSANERNGPDAKNVDAQSAHVHATTSAIATWSSPRQHAKTQAHDPQPSQRITYYHTRWTLNVGAGTWSP
jgi:hypothetical protein